MESLHLIAVLLGLGFGIGMGLLTRFRSNIKEEHQS